MGGTIGASRLTDEDEHCSRRPFTSKYGNSPRLGRYRLHRPLRPPLRPRCGHWTDLRLAPRRNGDVLSLRSLTVSTLMERM